MQRLIKVENLTICPGPSAHHVLFCQGPDTVQAAYTDFDLIQYPPCSSCETHCFLLINSA